MQLPDNRRSALPRNVPFDGTDTIASGTMRQSQLCQALHMPIICHVVSLVHCLFQVSRLRRPAITRWGGSRPPIPPPSAPYGRKAGCPTTVTAARLRTTTPPRGTRAACWQEHRQRQGRPNASSSDFSVLPCYVTVCDVSRTLDAIDNDTMPSCRIWFAGDALTNKPSASSESG